MMEFGSREMVALVSSGAIGSLLVWGYQKWIKPYLEKLFGK
jgi:hypothetical protein